MKETEKLGLTEALLGLALGLTVWLAAQVYTIAQVVSTLQQQNLDQDRRLERLENASAFNPSDSIHDDGGARHV